MNYKIFTFVMTDHRGNGQYEEDKNGVELYSKTKEGLEEELQRRLPSFNTKKAYLEFI